ncbi:gluconate 2-dehydrogenase subunit 3 family protein [Pedobacter sp. MC2016-14]|uniref:gluconate 2-dehydrogenase subunit 3 family protein n=1 Tax=Pedobacter sp. MC2016-14 TaxID=2897327 RepID=UPI001E403F24|nr:gluconate 2-dehydrogenase subunit 3 family protein [Pedobacter sp. MC2016-14]MCD0486630.1 gluconate 2-dehydrogenase subunit 3 family protein [Pedobacter sp. MC2016-14]
MDRRDAVKSFAFLMGGALSATTIGVFLEGCGNDSKKGNANLFSADHEKILAELADTIIPDTKTPGAKAAGVGPFIAMMIRDCYPEPAREEFLRGLNDLEERADKKFSKSFVAITPAQRIELLNVIRDETVASQKADEEKTGPAKSTDNISTPKSAKEDLTKPMAAKERYQEKPYFFAIARDLTLLGYFTSEIGATQAYEYVAIPGRYDGCVDLKPGQRVWA